MTLPVLPTSGAVLSMTPATGEVWFRADDGEEWTLPLIGWAITVGWTGIAEVHNNEMGEDIKDPEQVLSYDTSLEPVMQDEYGAHTMTSYLRDSDLSGKVKYEIRNASST